MQRHDLLSGLHERLRPRGYLEIGIRDGAGLARSRTRSIGVDPNYRITAELACDLQLVSATSDDLFARPDPLGWLPGGVSDLTFIDGMHLFEFALRDFINAERHAAAGGVVLFDDMLPMEQAHAARDRRTGIWAGDVYKVGLILERHRPDLAIVPVDTEPTGTLVVTGLDPASTVLRTRYDEIVAAFDTPDPQPVPDEVRDRRNAADPQLLLGCTDAWEGLLAARESGERPDAAVAALRALRGTATRRTIPREEPSPSLPDGRSVSAARNVTTPPPPPTGPVDAPVRATPQWQPRDGATVRGARVAILVVNGFDRFTQDPFNVDEARDFPWIDLCLSRVEQHTRDVDHEVLVWDNSYLPEHRAILDKHGVAVFEHPDQRDVQHGRALDGLTRRVSPKTKFVVTLDTDSFPVRDGWLSDLIRRLQNGADLAGVWRDEMSPDITPYIHPSCLAARRRLLKELDVSFQRAQAQDVAQNISLAVMERDGSLGGLRRSNRRNPHFLLAGVYGDAIYHHGAGSRKASFWTSEENQADEVARIVLRDAVFAHTDALLSYLRGQSTDAQARRAGLGDVVDLARRNGGAAVATPPSGNAGRGVATSVRRLAARLRR